MGQRARLKPKLAAKDKFRNVEIRFASPGRLNDDLSVMYGQTPLTLDQDGRMRLARAAARPGSVGWKGLTAEKIATAERVKAIRNYDAEI